MPASDNHFEEFKPHTLFKHAILEGYLTVWARVLSYGDPNRRRMRIVDACAGRGADEHGNEGSPLRIARIAEGAMEQLRADGREVQIDVLAIEKKLGHYRALRDNLAPFGERVRAAHGTLAEHIEEHYAEYGDAPTMFFIDPFGLSPIDAALIRRALHGPKNEVFFLFADQAALRHLGVLHAPDLEPEEHREVRAAKARGNAVDLFSLFGDDEAAEVEAAQAARMQSAKAAADRSINATTRGKQYSRKILDAAYGGPEWKQQIDATPPSRRRLRFVELYAELLRRLGARYVVPIPIFSGRERLVYHLIYATKSPKGIRVMKQAIQDARKMTGNTDDVEGPMSGLAAEEARGTVLASWAGRTVAWASEGSVEGLKDWCLSEIPDFYPGHANKLRELLAPYRVKGPGAWRYNFPHRPMP